MQNYLHPECHRKGGHIVYHPNWDPLEGEKDCYYHGVELCQSQPGWDMWLITTIIVVVFLCILSLVMHPFLYREYSACFIVCICIIYKIIPWVSTTIGHIEQPYCFFLCYKFFMWNLSEVLYLTNIYFSIFYELIYLRSGA